LLDGWQKELMWEQCFFLTSSRASVAEIVIAIQVALWPMQQANFPYIEHFYLWGRWKWTGQRAFFEDEITQGAWRILWMMGNGSRSRIEEGLQRIGKGTN